MHIDWEDDELLILQKSGNQSFKEFMSAYDLNECPIKQKYNSIACFYYRRMLQGYISGNPINELPPNKYEGCRILNENMDYEDYKWASHMVSPIKKEDSSIDLSRSSVGYIDKDYKPKWNNSIWLNKSNNVSRYSINIEAQNDLNQITILLGDQAHKTEKSKRRTHLSTEEAEVEEQKGIDLDDEELMSDKDKYSMYYESSHKHINMKELPDIRYPNRRRMEDTYFECQIEGAREIPTWWGGFVDGTTAKEQSLRFLKSTSRQIKEKSISVSKSLFSKTKEGLSKFMRSDAVTTFKSKFRDFLSPERIEEKPDDLDRYPSYSEEQTASTIPKGRRQSINYRSKKITPFYYD
jgi:hypothetical protein